MIIPALKNIRVIPCRAALILAPVLMGDAVGPMVKRNHWDILIQRPARNMKSATFKQIRKNISKSHEVEKIVFRRIYTALDKIPQSGI